VELKELCVTADLVNPTGEDVTKLVMLKKNNNDYDNKLNSYKIVNSKK